MGELSVEILESIPLKHKQTLSRLSILLGMDSFTYMITDDRRSVLALKQYDFGGQVRNPIDLGRKLQPLLVEEELFNQSFQKVSIAVDTANFTLVPEELYHETGKEAILREVATLADNEEVTADTLGFMPIRLVYPIDKGIRFLLQLQFPESRIYHSFSSFLAVARQVTIQEGIAGRYLFVNVRENTLQILLFDGEQLLLANNYPYRGKDDFMYFVFLIFDQFKLNPMQTPLYLSGKITENDSRFATLFNCIENVTLVDWPVTLLTGPNFNPSIKPRFFDLAGLMYC